MKSIDRQMRFYACDPCGQTGNATPQCLPVTGSLICDDRYFSLVTSTTGKLVVVPHGSNCQAFFKAADGARGFMFYGTDGQVYVENEPALTLPLVNPAASGIYPEPGFTYIMVGAGGSPTQWMFAKAPTEGDKMLVTSGGVWGFRDLGNVPGVTGVCSNVATVDKAAILGCYQTGVDVDGAPEYALRKITASQDRVLVGRVDAGTGVAGYQSLPLTDRLIHPMGRFPSILEIGKFTHVTGASDTPVPGGILQLPQVGTDKVEDAVPVVFSPTTQRFYRAPGRATSHMDENGADVVIANTGNFESAGGHATIANVPCLIGDVFVIASLKLKVELSGGETVDNYSCDLGLFIDGINVETFELKGSKDNTVHRLHAGLSIGDHDFEIRVNRPDAIPNGNELHVVASWMDVFSVW